MAGNVWNAGWRMDQNTGHEWDRNCFVTAQFISYCTIYSHIEISQLKFPRSLQ